MEADRLSGLESTHSHEIEKHISKQALLGCVKSAKIIMMRNREMKYRLLLFPLFFILGISNARDGAFIDAKFLIPPAEMSISD